MTTTSFAADSC